MLATRARRRSCGSSPASRVFPKSGDLMAVNDQQLIWEHPLRSRVEERRILPRACCRASWHFFSSRPSAPCQRRDPCACCGSALQSVHRHCAAEAAPSIDMMKDIARLVFSCALVGVLVGLTAGAPARAEDLHTGDMPPIRHVFLIVL